MDAVVNSNRSVADLLEREARDICARNELYGLLHFRLHPAPRIAQKLTEVMEGLDRRKIVKALEDSASTGRDLWVERLELMLQGDRAPYRRGKGYAAHLIDTVARAMGIMPPQIYAPDVPDIGASLDARICWLLDAPCRLCRETRMSLMARSLEVVPGEAGPTDLSASRLKQLAEDAGLPSYYFASNDVEWKGYEGFVGEVSLAVNEIIAFHLSGRALEALRRYTAKHYPRLLRNVEGQSPDAYVDLLYDKLRQQVLDGNTLLINYKIPMRNYLYHILANVLRDCVRAQATKKASQQVSLSRFSEGDRVWQCEAKVESEAVEGEHKVKLLRDVLSAVTCEEDRHVLCDALINVPLANKPASAVQPRTAKRALVLWAPAVVEMSNGHMEELPDSYRDLFAAYATSEWAATARALMRCDETARTRGRTRDWLANELSVSKHTLGKWIRCELSPRKEHLGRLRNAAGLVERRLLETSDNGRSVSTERSSCMA